MEFELERPPSIDDLLTVIINREDVEALIGRPVSQLGIVSITEKSHRKCTQDIHSIHRCTVENSHSKCLSIRTFFNTLHHFTIFSLSSGP